MAGFRDVPGVGLQFIPDGARAATLDGKCRAATTTNLAANTRTGNTLLFDAVGALGTIDGVTDLVAGDYLLVQDEVTDLKNGPYLIECAGSASTHVKLTRAEWASDSSQVTSGMLVRVTEGTANGDKLFQLTTNDPIVLNTTALAFAEDASASATTSLEAKLALATTPGGASYVGLFDTDDNLTAATVEAAIREIFTKLKATDATGLAVLMGIRDAANVIAAGNVEAALAELAVKDAGAPQQGCLRLLGAPGAAAEGNIVVIGADTYEFRGTTPPAGGTATRIWVYNGANSAASRANLVKAINGTVDTDVVTRTAQNASAGTNTELVSAVAGPTTGDVRVFTSAVIGSGTPNPSVAVVNTTTTLATGTDIWSAATLTGGVAKATLKHGIRTVILATAHIAKGSLQFTFPFTVSAGLYSLTNQMRPQNEAVTASGNYVSVVLAGGGSPNNQAADVLTVEAWGT